MKIRVRQTRPGSLSDPRRDSGDTSQLLLGSDRNVTGRDVALDALGQPQEAQVVADPSHVFLFADPFGELLVGGQILGFGEVSETLGRVDRVEILADQVLDERGSA
jgi:hypothetical protein